MSKLLLSFQKSIKSTKLAGVKARNLAILRQHGFPVPEFLVLSTRAHRPDRRIVDLTKIIQKALDRQHLYLPAEPIVARSSAPFEDLARFSLAGQLETVLNIRTIEQLLSAIKKIWDSVESSRLRNYFKEMGFSAAQKRVAVILQKQIDAEVSGVMFTSHPLSRDHLMLIELKEGGCEQIVSGQVTPFQIIVEKQFDRIIYSKDQSDTSLIFMKEAAPQLIRIGRDIERLFKRPMDIEWGYRDGKIWLYQARPITISAFTGQVIHDERGEQWTNYFFAERFDRHVSPLAWSFLGPIISKNAFEYPLWSLGKDDLRKKQPLIRCIHGVPHARLAVFRALYAVLPPNLVSHDKRNALLLEGKSSWPIALLQTLPFLMTRILHDWQFLPSVNLRTWRRFSTAVESQLPSLHSRMRPADIGEAKAIIEQTRILSDRFLSIHRWSITFADIFIGILDALIRRVRVDGSAVELLAGIPGNATVKADLALFACDPGNQDDREYFLAAFGHRGSSLDFSLPTWSDISVEIFDTQRRADVAQIRSRIERNQLRRSDLLVQLEKALTGKPFLINSCLKIIFPILYKMTTQFFLLRENQRDFWQKILYITRCSVLIIAEDMRQKGLVENVHDIFLLTYRELQAAVSGGLSVVKIVQKRKERQSVRQKTAAKVESPSASNLWVGIGVSEGTVTGQVRVALTYDEALIAEYGEIVVAPAADPAWTTIFGRIGGLVLENGGMLSHASIVAREFRLPTVTNIRAATTIFKTGDKIFLDGKSGIVKLHPSSENDSIDTDD